MSAIKLNGPADPNGWVWCGMAGHFIGGPDCRFHLCTHLPSGFRVSTVGDYYPKGDGGGRVALGLGDSYFETYVFRATECDASDEDHSAVASWTEIDSERTASRTEAEANHMAACRKWSVA
jgi:hypothetical protein